MNFRKSGLKCLNPLVGSKLNPVILSHSLGLWCFWLTENIGLVLSCGQNY